MPDIAAYRNAAASGYTGALALDDNGQHIVKASKNTSVSCLGRLFNTKACQRMTQNTLRNFKTALVEAYGEGTAELALRKTLGEDVYATLWPREGAAANHVEIPKFTVDKLKVALRHADHAVLDGLTAADDDLQNKTKIRLNELLAQEPLSDQERDGLIGKLRNALIRIDDSRLENEDITVLKDRIVQRLHDLNAKQLSQPTNGDVRKTVDRWIASGRAALEQQLQGVRDDAKNAILAAYDNDVCEALTNRMPRQADDNKAFAFSKATFTKDELKNFCGLVCDRTKACVKNHLAAIPLPDRPDFHFSSADFKTAIKAEHHRLVNTNPEGWNTITRNFTVKMDGQTLQLSSELRPAKEIANNRDVYGQGSPLKGNNCHDTSSEHVLNCWSAKFSVNGQQICAAHRSATLWPYGCDGHEERRTRGINRAVEYVKTIFHSRADLQQLVNGSNDNPVEVPFDIVSIGLLSMLGKEGKMVQGQFEIWEAINSMSQANDPQLTIQENGKTIRLKPTVHSSNFGVNSVSLKLPFGWGKANAHNNQTIIYLLSKAQARIAELNGQNPPDQAKINAITTLRDQIAAMQADPSTYRSEKGEAYKMSSRLTLLTDLLGLSAVFNCKSGKDRTGVNDTEYKFLATLAHLGKPLPEPGAELTFEQQALYRAIMQQSGNLEVQRDNTGFEGFKAVTGMSSTQDRMGADYMAAMEKASALVSK